MQAKLAAFKKSGAISGEDFAIYSAKIEEARAAVGKTATSMHTLSLNSALARRELGRMGTDIATGNFGRLSQTSLTLANYTGLMGLAFTAAGAAILGTVAVVGTFIAAAAKGWAETERLRVSIIATGGAAGVTADQLNAMAESVGKTTGEYGDARKAIEQLAASGKVAGAGLGGLAE
jgi:phage-related minor tail protein